ncbi:LysM peptidoglycan-binding domain-containing protein [Rhizobium sp. L1K21]|uniref:LysM peptidoglycan-binding domain-containing protein n=1 Tax=Rhizobium sp. L1K21 TaxID=2954933 RepID=UPI0020929DFA|nr:LysM peptidoglycan-binding domain-containing protein [Rhizobium sp. L1K21]MCO6186558.1 LysM peptidoglycan-binding domain-containing protein [Rhizobium sp. L1K21]
MMKNRAGLVALLVVAIAAVVMIFFVLPGRKGADELADKAGDVTEAAKEAAGDAADKADRVKEALSSPEIMEKVERLKSDAEAAAASLQSLFENGRIPSEEELADAKAKAEAALKAITDFQAPEGAESAVDSVVSGMKENAAKALAAVKSIPDDAQNAAAAVTGLKDFFGMKSDDKVAAAPEEDSETGAAPTAIAQMPTFDVLRVEKDGSTVIAGKGTPGARIELVDGDKVIATQDIDATGDFAIVLDQPLAAGDHQLVLRVTDKDGNTTVSEEVATVSVPEDQSGELLAMVSKPGEASRILTMPQAEPEVAAVQPSQETADAAPSAQAETAAPAATEPKTEDAGSSEQGEATSQMANAAPATAAQTQPAEIRVTAVELEGDNIYVAGEALPGAALKVYADDKLVGDTTADAEGHFVAEGVMPLTVGNHIIRADVIEKATGKVVVRASVPFNRPEGARVAVAANTDNAAAAVNSPDGLAISQLTQLREETAKALVLLKGLFADGKTPETDALAAARSATKIALNALASFKPGPEASQQTMAAADKAAASAADALKILDGLKDDPAAVAAAIPSIEKAAAEAIAPVTADAVSENIAQVEPPAASADNMSEQAKPASEQSETQVADQSPKTIEQAPLENDENAVVIRRGDTLWQISRRLYGKGIRYTTIYLANQKEILDPNMINPGQVFKIPQDVLEDDLKAEETNRNLQSR